MAESKVRREARSERLTSFFPVHRGRRGAHFDSIAVARSANGDPINYAYARSIDEVERDLLSSSSRAGRKFSWS